MYEEIYEKNGLEPIDGILQTYLRRMRKGKHIHTKLINIISNYKIKKKTKNHNQYVET